MARTETQQTISAATLSAYGSIAGPLAILVVPLYNYLPTFYASELGLNLSAIGAIFFVTRLWDAFLDPLVGVWSDRTSLDWGRRKPWIAISAPVLMILSYFICVPPDSAGYVYLSSVLFLFYLAWTCVQIPHLAWGAELAAGYQDRTRVVAVREAFFMVGILSAVALPAILFGADELDLRRIMSLYAGMTLVLIPMTVIPAIYLVPDGSKPVGKSRILWSEAMQVVRGRPAFQRLIGSYFLMQLGLTIYDTIVLFYVTRVLGLDHLFLLLACLQFVITIVTMPAMVRLGRYVEKHTLLLGFTIIFPIGTIVLASAPPDSSAFAIVSFAIIGLSVAPYRIMPTSMVADCAELDCRISGDNREGTHMAIITFIFKLALAAGVGVGFPMLEAIGFDSSGSNSETTLSRLRLMMMVLPAVFMLLSAATLWRYPLTRDSRLRCAGGVVGPR